MGLRKADEPMKTFSITETEQGNDFGNFQAEDKQGALEALAKDAGYDSYAEMREVASNGTLRVTEVVECAYCQRMVSAAAHEHNQAPSADDDTAWDELAAEHAEGCEWIATRAHRRNAA